MLRMYASNSHSYAHSILALGIVREPTVWGFITSQYPGIHDIGLPTYYPVTQSTIVVPKPRLLCSQPDLARHAEALPRWLTS